MHRLNCLPKPRAIFFTLFKKMVAQYLWGDNPPRIAYNRLIQDENRLGLKLIDLETKQEALLAMWPIRWTQRKEEADWVYQQLPIKDERAWECNINEKDLKYWHQAAAMSVVKHIWLVWHKVTYEEPLELEEILQQNLWGNSAIRYANKPIFEKKLLSSNIEKVLDLVDITTGNFLTYDQVRDIFGEVIEPLTYCSIIAAVPLKWKVKIRSKQLRQEIDITTKLEKIEQAKPIGRKIYWKQKGKKFPSKLFAKEAWSKDLGSKISEEEWWNLYPKFKTNVLATKLRYFQYRVLTRQITTNVLRNKSDKRIDPNCAICGEEKETVNHLLYSCRKISCIWKALEKWCKYFLNLPIQFTLEVTILNNYKGPLSKLINTFIIILKQYIYACKCLQEIPTFRKMIQKITRWHEIEYQMALLSDTIPKHQKKWEKYVDI